MADRVDFLMQACRVGVGCECLWMQRAADGDWVGGFSLLLLRQMQWRGIIWYVELVLIVPTATNICGNSHTMIKYCDWPFAFDVRVANLQNEYSQHLHAWVDNVDELIWSFRIRCAAKTFLISFCFRCDNSEFLLSSTIFWSVAREGASEARLFRRISSVVCAVQSRILQLIILYLVFMYSAPKNRNEV